MPTYGNPTPEFNSEESRRASVVKWINTLWSHSLQENWAYRNAIPKIYEQYRGIRTRRYHVHKNNISTSLLYTIIWSHAARIMNMIFGQSPAIRFMGAGQGEEEAAIGRKQD